MSVMTLEILQFKNFLKMSVEDQKSHNKNLAAATLPQNLGGKMIFQKTRAKCKQCPRIVRFRCPNKETITTAERPSPLTLLHKL